MKTLRIFLAVVLITVIVAVRPVAAADLGIGIAGWYTWWDVDVADRDPDMTSGPMYGPMISFGFAGNWSLSAVFLYGYFKLEGVDYTEDLYRFDSDVTLNYNITRVLKVFAGVKLMGYRWEMDFSGSTDKGVQYGVGPAAGIGVTVPLTENLFCLVNVSGLYLRGRNTLDSDLGNDQATMLTEYGFNSTLGIAWYIVPASTTLTLGFRYQYFYMVHDNKDEFSYLSHNHFYGVTASAVYAFGL